MYVKMDLEKEIIKKLDVLIVLLEIANNVMEISINVKFVSQDSEYGLMSMDKNKNASLVLNIAHNVMLTDDHVKYVCLDTIWETESATNKDKTVLDTLVVENVISVFMDID